MQGVGGVMASIVAFQAVDPGSTPGRRTFLSPLNCICFFYIILELLKVLVIAIIIITSALSKFKVRRLNSLSSIGGSVVECSPATRAARVRFLADATRIFC